MYRWLNLYALTILALLCLFPMRSRAQWCSGAVNYIARDRTGEFLDAQKIEIQAILDGREASDAVSIIKHIGEGSPPVSVIHTPTSCGYKLFELTLKYDNATMRLKWRNVPEREDYFVDSLPFQEGTFELDLTNWDKLRRSQQSWSSEGYFVTSDANTLIRTYEVESNFRTARVVKKTYEVISAEEWKKLETSSLFILSNLKIF